MRCPTLPTTGMSTKLTNWCKWSEWDVSAHNLVQTMGKHADCFMKVITGRHSRKQGSRCCWTNGI